MKYNICYAKLLSLPFFLKKPTRERDHGNTHEVQRARSLMMCKYCGMGLGGSQISRENKGRSFISSAIEVIF